MKLAEEEETESYQYLNLSLLVWEKTRSEKLQKSQTIRPL
jgi:hypothetical protein